MTGLFTHLVGTIQLSDQPSTRCTVSDVSEPVLSHYHSTLTHLATQVLPVRIVHQWHSCAEAFKSSATALTEDAGSLLLSDDKTIEIIRDTIVGTVKAMLNKRIFAEDSITETNHADVSAMSLADVRNTVEPIVAALHRRRVKEDRQSIMSMLQDMEDMSGLGCSHPSSGEHTCDSN